MDKAGVTYSGRDASGKAIVIEELKGAGSIQAPPPRPQQFPSFLVNGKPVSHSDAQAAFNSIMGKVTTTWDTE